MKINYQKFAYYLAIATLIWACVITLVPIIFQPLLWVFGLESYDFSYSFVDGLTVNPTLNNATPLVTLSVFTLDLARALLMAFGLLGLRITFLEAAQSNALSQRAINGFKRFAWVSFLLLLINPFINFTMFLIRAFADPTSLGGKISFSFEEIFKDLFMGLLLIFVAYIFAEGRRVQDENERFL